MDQAAAAKRFGEVVCWLRDNTYPRREPGMELAARRIRAWTQKELADYLRISPRTLRRIENGEGKNGQSPPLPQPWLVTKMADAFNLTSMERKAFFLLAFRGVHEALLSSREVAQPHLGDLHLGDLQRQLVATAFPGFLMDSLCNLIVPTTMISKLLNVDESLFLNAHGADRANILRVVFANDSYEQLTGNHDPAHWYRTAIVNIQFFRAVTLQHRGTPAFDAIFEALWRYPRFQRFWDLAELEPEYRLFQVAYHYEHPLHKRLRYIAVNTPHLTEGGEVYSVVYVPQDAHTRTVFTDLYDKFGNDLIPVPPAVVRRREPRSLAAD